MNFKTLIIGLLLAVSLMFAQSDGTWVTNAGVTNLAQGKVVNFTFAVDSTGTLTSNSFAVHEFDDYLYSTETLQFAYKFASDSGNPIISAFIDGSFDNSNFSRIDTLFSSGTATTMTFGSADMNSIHAPYLRITFVGITASGEDQNGWLQLYFYQGRDEY